jgi:hypothetical protein
MYYVCHKGKCNIDDEGAKYLAKLDSLYSLELSRVVIE